MREHPKCGEGHLSFSSITEVVSVRVQRKTRLLQLRTAEVSGGLGQTVTRYRCGFRVPDCSSPTFLPPLAPRPLRRFNATMEALTPVRVSPAYRSPCFTYLTFRTIPSPTTWCSPVVALAPYPSARQVSLAGTPATQCLPISGLDFAFSQQARRKHPAETGSLSYGLVVHLLLLPTPPRGDAVTVGYRPEKVYLEMTCTSLIKYARRRTSSRLSGSPPRGY